jgi:hypothetical protein
MPKYSKLKQKITSSQHFLLLLCSLLFSLACSDLSLGEDDSGSEVDKIINGTYDAKDYAVVAIGYSYGFYCTGTLIKPKVVLTAGHCVALFDQDKAKTNYWLKQDQVYAHVVKNGKVTEKAKVVKGVMHPEWDGEDLFVGSDLAVLYLDKALSPTPLNIDTAEPNRRVGRNGRAIGYGLTEGGNYDSNPQRKKMSVTLALQSVTSDQRIIELVSPDETPRGTCNGDSGGPFVMKNAQGKTVVVGVASFVPVGCTGTSYHIAAQPFLNWINGNIPKATSGNRVLPLPSCYRYDLCLKTCSTETCRNKCANRASQIALKEYEALQACASANQCQDQGCIDTFCADYQNACYTKDNELNLANVADDSLLRTDLELEEEVQEAIDTPAE